jgi:large-conductance mechanosensitive channel
VKTLDIAKTAVSIVVGAGTNKIISAIVDNNTEPESVRDKVAIKAGTITVSAMVAAKTKEYTDAKIDEAAAFYNEHIAPKFKK